jgi:uncharacterized protein
LIPILDSVEARVLGALIEKEMSTPDYYPLSLNALINACNQKTNRDPVSAYGESDVTPALASLREKRLAIIHTSDRVPKHSHRCYETLDLGRREIALIGVLLLRGPQTAAELKERTQRLHEFEDLDTVELCLKRLSESGLTVLLERQPGQREARWSHLLFGEPQISPAAAPEVTASRDDRLTQLEIEFAQLRAEFEDFKRRFE